MRGEGGRDAPRCPSSRKPARATGAPDSGARAAATRSPGLCTPPHTHLAVIHAARGGGAGSRGGRPRGRGHERRVSGGGERSAGAPREPATPTPSSPSFARWAARAVTRATAPEWKKGGPRGVLFGGRDFPRPRPRPRRVCGGRSKCALSSSRGGGGKGEEGRRERARSRARASPCPPEPANPSPPPHQSITWSTACPQSRCAACAPGPAPGAAWPTRGGRTGRPRRRHRPTCAAATRPRRPPTAAGARPTRTRSARRRRTRRRLGA